MKSVSFAIASASLFLCLLITGCSNSVPANQTELKHGGELIASGESSSSSVEDDQQSMDDFLQEMTNYISMSSQLMETSLNALQDNDSTACTKADMQIGELYENVYDMDDVPEGAELCHQYVLEALLYSRACTSFYASSAMSSNIQEKGELLRKGTASMNDATEAMKKYSDEMTQLYRNLMAVEK